MIKKTATSIFLLCTILVMLFSCSKKAHLPSVQFSGYEANNEVDVLLTMVSDLLGTTWVLYELNGQQLDSSRVGTTPFISFSTEDMRVHGNDGCNNFFGSYELYADGAIDFLQMASTKMACPDADIDYNFMQAFSSVNIIQVLSDTLFLKQDKDIRLLFLKDM